jgi:hypothetical protein
MPMIAEVLETESVVLCGALLAAVKVRLDGAKPQEAEEGNVPQLKVSVPAKPLVGVRVRVVVPTDPWTIVRVDGENAAVGVGASGLKVTVCELVVVTA